MPRVGDFRRTSTLAVDKVEMGGKYVGKKTYWRLYAIENLYRILIHSVLLAEFGTNWWATVTSKKKQKDIIKLQERYKNSPWPSSPGDHEIYYIYLSDLNKIVGENVERFRPVIQDIDDVILNIEKIGLSRNVIAHMNFPSRTDRERIDSAHEYIKKMFLAVEKSRVLELRIPS